VEGDDHGEAYTAILWGVGMSHEMVTTQGPRRSKTSKATCAEPLCEVPSPCRGLRPHHARKERVGTWEISCPAGRRPAAPVRIGKARSR